MKILGISAFYHDSAAALVQDGIIIAAAQEERFTRKKQDASFPTNAVKYCLEYSGLSIDKLDAVVFYDKPLLKFERLLDTYYNFSPKGLTSFMTSMPVFLREKMFLKKLLFDELKKIEPYEKKNLKLLFPEHHLSHAASAFYPSPYEESAILTIDGVGEWATASICHGRGSQIEILKELRFPHSLGLLYSAVTYFLGFKVNSGEYKLMGLAPYGNSEDSVIEEYKKNIKENILTVYEDGSLWLNQEYFNYATGLTMVIEKKWEKLFGISKRKPESELTQEHCNLGLAFQQITEEVVIKMAKEAKRLTHSKYLCLSGGVALNCVANGKLEDENVFEDIFIQPAAGDSGGALGAALVGHYIYFEKDRIVSERNDSMLGSFLGPNYSDLDIERMSKKYNAVYNCQSDNNILYDQIAKHIEDGKAVGWMQGRMEFGPRALGGRSIIGDARNAEMQKKLNLKIKYRESFRPFAPSVLAEDVSIFFEHSKSSPYMLLVKPVSKNIRKQLPSEYSSFDLKEKLYYERSELPAITHIDFSARIQTVHRKTNPKYYELIKAFKKRTGVGVVVNTSFNVRGEPIVCTPEDAYRCFMRTEMDVLVIENFVFLKKDQPEWDEKDDWQMEFVLD